jgi:hypothetical protein
MRGPTISPARVTPTTLIARPRGVCVPNASFVPSGEKAGQTFQILPSRLPATSLG